MHTMGNDYQMAHRRQQIMEKLDARQLESSESGTCRPARNGLRRQMTWLLVLAVAAVLAATFLSGLLRPDGARATDLWSRAERRTGVVLRQVADRRACHARFSVGYDAFVGFGDPLRTPVPPCQVLQDWL